MICGLCGKARATRRVIVTNSKGVTSLRANTCAECNKHIVREAERKSMRVTIIYLKGGK